MTETQPTWDALAAKTWAEIAGESEERIQSSLRAEKRRLQLEQALGHDPYLIEIGAKLDAQQAEIETLKARVAELEARLLERRVPDDVAERTFGRAYG